MTVGGELSEYELQRQRNIENNKAVLASLGLDSPVEFQPTRRTVSAPTKKPVKRVAVKDVAEDKTSDSSSVVEPQVRRSGRERKKPVLYTGNESTREVVQEEWEEMEEEKEDEEKYTRSRGKKEFPQRIVAMPKGSKWNGGNVFGSIPNVHVGQTWEKRCDVSWAGIHRPWVAGIFGNPKIGCYSICLSGGYEDDIDYGDAFVYTGAGGRDLKGTKANPKNLRSAPQSSDQTLTGSNLALHLNIESRKPVRVVRGFKSPSQYAPDSGYRYDGLYTVETSWMDTGLSGFKVWHFALKRIPGQPPIGQDYETFGNVIVTPSRREGLRNGKKTNSEAESISSALPKVDANVDEEIRNGEETEEEELQSEEAVTVPVSAKRKTRSSGSPGRKNAKVKKTAENGAEREVAVSLLSSTTDGPVVGDGGVSSSDLPGEPCESQESANGAGDGDPARPTEVEESVGR